MNTEETISRIIQRAKATRLNYLTGWECEWCGHEMEHEIGATTCACRKCGGPRKPVLCICAGLPISDPEEYLAVVDFMEGMA